jgi:hypothetical protein
MIPSGIPGRFIGLRDNGFGAQGNNADFVIGFYEVTPQFKTGDGTSSRGPVVIHGFTHFSDPDGSSIRRMSPTDRSTNASSTTRRGPRFRSIQLFAMASG